MNLINQTKANKNSLIWLFLIGGLLLGEVVSAQTPTQQFPMEQFIGVNLRREDPIKYLNAVGFVRDYRDWVIDEGNSVTATNPAPLPLPLNKYKWNPGFGSTTNFDNFYNDINVKVGNGNICATMKSCLPYLAGGDVFGIYSEFKPIPHAWSGTNNNLQIPSNNVGFAFNPLAGESTTNPNSYRWISDWIYQYTLRYGNGTDNTTNLKLHDNETSLRNSNKIKYVELWNEPDKYWIKTYEKEKICEIPTDGWLNATKFTGAEYAAMASAVYDAHGQTISIGDGKVVNGVMGTYKPGIAVADPNMKLVLGGTAGIREYDWKFIKDMKNWFTTNRPGVMPFKVINFHHYNSSIWQGLPGAIAINGEEAASPEEDRWNMGPFANVDEYGRKSSIPDPSDNETNICKKQRLNVEDAIPTSFSGKIDPTNPATPNYRTFKQRLLELKSKVTTEFPGVEIWMSEFGFDTNERSPYRAPHLKDINGNIVLTDRQEVQGRFLVRASLEIASAGWDRAMIYDLRDEDSGVDASLFQGSGLVKDKTNNFAPKKSYYYVSTMKEALMGTKFSNEVTIGSDLSLVPTGIYAGHSYNFSSADYPRISKFTTTAASPTVAGSIVYAVWLPTKQNLTKTNYLLQLPTGTTQATMVKTRVGDFNGVKQSMSVGGIGTANPFVIIPEISENPMYIRLGESINEGSIAAPVVNSATGVSCDAIKLSINAMTNTTYSVYYFEKNDKEENGVIPIFDINNPNLKLFSNEITASDILVGGLILGHDKYHFFVLAKNNTTGNISEPTRVEATTTSCSNNVIPLKVASVSQNDAELKEILRTDNFSLCYPIRNYNALPEWVSFAPGAPKQGDIVLCNAQGVENSYRIDLVSLLDGNDDGIVFLEWANQDNNFSTNWFKYITNGLNVWSHTPKSVTASRIRINRNDNNSKIRKLILRGVPASNTTYATACCGANEPNIKTITGNTTTSAQIADGNLLGNGCCDRQVVKITGTLTVDNPYVFSNNSLIYMDQGSKISLNPSPYNINFLYLLSGTSLQGCDTKWQGIELSPGSALYADNANIRDAVNAAYLKNTPDNGASNWCIFSNSVIEENEHGATNQYGVNSTNDYVYAVNTIFDGNNRDLKPDYPGRSYSFNPQKSLTGINLQRNANGYIGYPSSWGAGSNKFQNLAMGIYSNNDGNLSVQNSEFRNINTVKVTDPYWGGLQDYGGNGIQKVGTGNLTVLGMGIADKLPMTFDKVKIPIYSSYSNVDIQNCKITTTLDNTTTWWWYTINYGGIYINYDNFNAAGTNIIKNNIIRANGSGITLVYPNNATQIENNTIDCNDIATYKPNTAGSNISVSGSNYSIKNNTLIMNPLKKSNGVYMNAVSGGNILNNKIFSRDYLESAKSIDSTFLINVINSPNNFVQNNTLTGVGGGSNTTAYNVGINMISSPNNSITCNDISGTRIGITADANNQTGNSQSNANIQGIAGNVFANYNQGLLLRSGSAILGQHNHKMNRWKNASSINKAGEFINTDVNQLALSRFRVGNSTNNGSNDSEINPTAISGAVKVNVGVATNWFLPEAASSIFSCSSVGAGLLSGNGIAQTLQTRGDAESEFYAEGEHPFVNRKVAEDAAKMKKDLNLSDASIWMMEQDAYTYYKEKLKSNLPTTKALKEFFKKHDSGDIGTMANLDDEWSKLQKEEFKTQNQQARMADKRLGELMENQNRRIDFKKLADMKDGKNAKEYLQSFTNDSIKILQKQISNLQKEYEANVAKKVEKLLSINAKLSGDLPYVKYEKEINEMRFTLLGDRTKKLTKEQVSRVVEIAMMCPEEAGKAPYKARALYLLVNSIPLPDWSDKCRQKIQVRPITAASTLNLAIYPNPASDNIVVSIEKVVDTEGYQWQITDIAGGNVKTGKFNSNLETISTVGLNSGTYMIRVIKDNTPVKVEKFSIIK
jgi:Secretion system C-terminal sorting domain